MKLKKALALTLSAALVLSLAACGNDAQTPSPDASGSPDVSSGDTSPASPNLTAYTQAVAGVDPDTVLLTINDTDMTAEFYLYWLAYDCTYWDSMGQMYGMPLDFEELLDEESGQTVGQFLKDDARQMAAAYLLMEQNAAKQNCGPTVEQLAEWDQFKKENLGSEDPETFQAFLKQVGLSEETLNRIGMIVNGYLYSNLTETLVPQPTDAELDQYISESDTYLAKHILICTAVENEDGTVSMSTGGAPVNEDGSEFTGTAQEYNDAARAKAEDIVAQLNASDDPLTLFDTLMFEHSEDTGLTSNPGGYTFNSTTSFVDEFKNTVYDLEYNEYSDIVESTFGYHIILRLRPDVAEEYRGSQMSDIVNGWLDEMNVVTTAEYDALDAATFYAAYQEYQAVLAADLAEEPASSPEG